MRVSFLIDGFNLYHSTIAVQNMLNAPAKWLDIKTILWSYQPFYSKIGGERVIMNEFFYFSAFAFHREKNDPDVIYRHKCLLQCFEDQGINIEMHQFKNKQTVCPVCNYEWIKHEEKETDVAIAIKLMELFILDLCDMAVIVSGDTDIAPAVKTAKRLYPNKKIVFVFPFRRKNDKLETISDGAITIKPAVYAHNQLPSPYICKDGKKIIKPSTW